MFLQKRSYLTEGGSRDSGPKGVCVGYESPLPPARYGRTLAARPSKDAPARVPKTEDPRDSGSEVPFPRLEINTPVASSDRLSPNLNPTRLSVTRNQSRNAKHRDPNAQQPVDPLEVRSINWRDSSQTIVTSPLPREGLSRHQVSCIILLRTPTSVQGKEVFRGR